MTAAVEAETQGWRRQQNQQVGVQLVDLEKAYTPEAVVVKGINLTVEPGSMVSLLGPSGCGKTTTLRMIAGLEDPTGGQIKVGGEVVSARGNVVPPERRNMGMVFQTYALWPHMDVFANVAYGLQRHKVPKAQVAEEVQKVLELVGMSPYRDRYPSQLSGGQQQRVALARAIANQPSILLFDEPLSNLDAVLRETMRFEIRELQQRLGTTGIYVTHSQDEALALSDRLAIMRDGVIIQEGRPEEVYERPNSEFVASFIGLSNTLTVSAVQPDGERLVGRLSSGEPVRIGGRTEHLAAGATAAKVAIRPENLRIAPHQTGATSSGLSLSGQVDRVNFTGGIVDYFVHVEDGTEVRVQSTPPISAAPGDTVTLQFEAEHVIVLDDPIDS